jgi:hypothetical protein
MKFSFYFLCVFYYDHNFTFAFFSNCYDDLLKTIFYFILIVLMSFL